MPSVQRNGKAGAAELPMFGFALSALLTQVTRDFPELSSKRVEVWMRNQPTLATVCSEEGKVVVALHAVLNHVDTPERVVGFILRHELLHMIIPSREVDGRNSAHPPEFWNVESGFPDRRMVWSWLLLVLGCCLRRDKSKECMFVTRKWKARMNDTRPSLDEIEHLLNGGSPLRAALGGRSF